MRPSAIAFLHLLHLLLLLLLLLQVRGLCLSARGGVPASFLSSQQSAEEAAAVKRELGKV
jgi:hypothetical protein